MMSELISSNTNPLVKLIHALHQKKTRQQTSLFLVEGIHPVGEAIEAGWILEALVFSPDLLTSDFALGLVDEQSRQGVRCVSLPRHLFVAVASKDNPQGILAVVHQQIITLEDLAPQYFVFGAAVVSPQDPGNLGTILRTLDAVGADGLFLLDGGVELYHPSAVRASMGAIFWKPVVQTSFVEFDLWRQDNNYRLVGTSAHAKTDYRNFQRDGRPIILLLGNEQKGLSLQQTDACDDVLSIPMKGRGSSLNLAVAAGVLLYQLIEKK